MIFTRHSSLEGKHAFLSPSSYSWLNYDIPKLKQVYANHFAKIRGTELHGLAKDCIRLKIKLEQDGTSLPMFVNDAIDFNLTPEVVLYYSDFCFGTSDAIGIHNNVLHVHDYKSGSVKASFKQLLIYTALFHLEYDHLYQFTPETLPAELRIYQNGEVSIEIPDPESVIFVMEKIINSDEVLHQMGGDLSKWNSEY